VALYFIVCTPISYLVGRERIFDDVTANNSNEYVTIKVDRHVVLAYTKVQEPSHKSYITRPLQNKLRKVPHFRALDLHDPCGASAALAFLIVTEGV
jgi:hypothetical protein